MPWTFYDFISHQYGFFLFTPVTVVIAWRALSHLTPPADLARVDRVPDTHAVESSGRRASERYTQ
jgi:hypothetical protein